MRISLDPAAEADIDDILAISQAVSSTHNLVPSSRTEVQKLLANTWTFVIESSPFPAGQWVSAGYLSVKVLDQDKEVYVAELQIHPMLQGYGIGPNVLELLAGIAAYHGCKRLSLVTSPENAAAIKVYRSVGFIQADRIRNYHGTGTDRLIFMRRL